MENPRTTSARDHDDSKLIDAAESAPGGAGSAGGNLARDVASANELAEVDDPEARDRVSKQAAIDNDTARRSQRPR